MSKGKKQHHESHIDETWLIPYADILTLLLALFIVLFASSKIDMKKFEQLVQSFNVALNGGVGVMQNPSVIKFDPTLEATTVPPKKDGENANAQEHKSEEQKKLEQAFAKETQDLQKMKAQLDGYIQHNRLQDKLQTKLSDEGLLITILDNALFDSGSAALKPEARALAAEISNLLVPHPKQVTVTGHTDNRPIHTAEFPSNWDLSTKRATNFLKVLLENKALQPAKFSATGKGEFHPVADNNTPEGRAKNRRVEVEILRDFTTK